MMIRHSINILSLFLLGIFTSCAYESPTSVNFKLTSTNDFAEQTGSEFHIDTAARTLIITVVINNVSSLKFPVHAETKDTLCYAPLRFEFFEGGQPIQSKDCKCSFSYSNLSYSGLYATASQTLSFTSDTLDLSYPQRVTFKLPLYHLRALQAGKRNITLKISSEDFFSRPRKAEKIVGTERRSVTERLRMKGKGMQVALNYALHMPKVYSSSFICERITLQNDSNWNPAGSDFTIFRSSLPDIYYEIYTPQEFMLYRSPFQRSTIEFSRPDTCTLYFYSIADSISIGVYDHDNFSRDDVLGLLRCSVKDLQASASSPLKSDHITKFSARLLNIKTEN